jgi:hypothetical protein
MKKSGVMSPEKVANSFFGPLRGWERGLLITSGVFGVVALVFMGYLIYEWYVTYYHDFLTFGEAIGPIGGLMSGLVGSLFAFAGSILFFVALMVQLREHRQSITELEKTTTNHRQALRITRQEKEFNICLQAAKDVILEYQEFKAHDIKGPEAIAQLTNKWYQCLTDDMLSWNARRQTQYFLQRQYPDTVFFGFQQLYDLNLRMYWTFRAINNKKIASDDMAYLNTLIMPTIKALCSAQDPGLVRTMARLDELAALSNEKLDRFKLNTEVLGYYKADLQTLYDVRSSKVMKAM